jgi:hypothetical protein
MTVRFRTALASLLALALPAAVLASIPGNLEQRAYENLQHVCTDTEPDDVDDYIPCLAQEGDVDTAPYTGVECTAAGLPAECVIDFIPKVKLKGTILLTHDDQAFESTNTFSIQASAIVVELKKGKKRATFVELFDGSTLGNWNTFDETFLLPADDGSLPIVDYTNAAGTAYQFAQGTLFELGLEVRDLAAAWFPKADLTDAVAVLTSIEADPKRKALEHDDDALASASGFKIEVQFARTRP